MYVTESRAQLGFLPLQHENFGKEVGPRLDQRTAIFGLKVFEHLTGPEDRGRFLIDDRSVGDVIGSFLWPNATRGIPAWRLGAWPVITVKERSKVAPAAFGQLFSPGPRAPRLGGETESKELKEIFLPIRTEDFGEDKRFRELEFTKPKIRFDVDRDDAFSSIRESIDAWPKFPVGWHGIALAADEETKQNDLFMPADPRLVLVNHTEADPDAGTRIVELTGKNDVDPRRMGRLHSAFRVLRGPAIFCDVRTTARFEERVDVGTLALNVHSSGGADALPGGLMIGPPTGGTGGGVDAFGEPIVPRPRSTTTAVAGAPGGPAGGSELVVAALSSSRGGPIDLGSTIDRHRIGSVDGLPINQAHISGGALYRFGPGGRFDAPLLHHGQAVVGGAALPEELERIESETGGIIPVFFVYDPVIPHGNFCGRSVPGHHRWVAVIPDEESGRPGPEETETVNVDRGSDLFFAGMPPPPPPPPPPEPPGRPGEDPVGRPDDPPPPPPPPLPPIGRPAETDDTTDVDRGAPPEACPPEGTPPLIPPDEDPTSPFDGPCTSGPINGPGLSPPDSRAEEIRNAIFGPRNAPIWNANATGSLPSPGYRAGSLDVFRLATLSAEGHPLHPQDLVSLRNWRRSNSASFKGAPYSGRGHETFVDTQRARGISHLFFRASWLGDTAPNYPQWTGRGRGGGSAVPSKKTRDLRSLTPVVARYEAWGNQTDTIMGFNYGDNLFRSRYLNLGTSGGGVAILPPETSIDDIRRGVQRSDQSQICLLLADRVDLCIGSEPSVADGSVRLGWILRERQSTDNLSIMRGKTTAPVDADSVIRLDALDNFHFDLGQGDADAASGVGVIPIRNAGTNPSGTPANGVVLFASGGEIFVLDGFGVTTNLATGGGGAPAGNTVTVTGDFTVGPSNDVILVDASGTAGDITITLPENTTAADLDGKRFTVKKIDSTDSEVIVVGTSPLTSGQNLIDGEFSVTIRHEDDAYEFTSDGTSWFITADRDTDSIRTFTASTSVFEDTLEFGEDVILVDASARTVTIELPPVFEMAGRSVLIKKIDSTTNTLTVVTPGSETIDGFNERVIYNEDDAFRLVSDGVNWRIVSEPTQTRSCLVVTESTSVDIGTHEVILVDASGATSGDVTITLPATIGDLHGTRFVVKKIDSSANTVTIQGTDQLTAGDNLIDGQFTKTLSVEDSFIEVTQDGSAWFITAGRGTGPLNDNVRTFARTTASSITILDSSDDVILVDATLGTTIAELPAASVNSGKRYTVKKIDSTANLVRLRRSGSDVIDGSSRVDLLLTDAFVEVVSDGVSEWHITGLELVPSSNGLSLGFGPIVDKTINTAGAVAVTASHLRLSGTTADTLVDLTDPGNLNDGDLVMIRPASGQTIVVETNTGNIRLDNAVDITLQTVNHNIVLAWNATSSRFFQVSNGVGQA